MIPKELHSIFFEQEVDEQEVLFRPGLRLKISDRQLEEAEEGELPILVVTCEQEVDYAPLHPMNMPPGVKDEEEWASVLNFMWRPVRDEHGGFVNGRVDLPEGEQMTLSGGAPVIGLWRERGGAQAGGAQAAGTKRKRLRPQSFWRGLKY